MSSSEYYPLAVGNTWNYQIKGGQPYTSTVISQDGDTFTVQTTLVDKTSHIRRVGDEYQSDGVEPGKWQITLKENLKKGDTWQTSYKVNGIDNTLIYVVKEAGLTKEVNGKTFPDVIHIEADTKMSMNGKPIPMTYLIQYYYARGVGVILTISSQGEEHGLVDYKVK